MRLPMSLSALLIAAAFSAVPGQAGTPRSAAVFDVAFVDTSPEPVTPAETDRLHRLGDALRQSLAGSGQYRIVDLGPARAEIAANGDLSGCNCELDIARKLGAQLAVVSSVQKVSNLILNINIRIEEVATGKTLKGGSVDIRGNTDESWSRGLKFLLDEHVFDDRP